MDKGIGFNRNVFLPWLDTAAAFSTETDDPTELRARLEAVLNQDIKGVDARRKTIDILISIWLKSATFVPALQAEAVTRYQASTCPGDRLWLHYGLTLAYYPFFRQCAAAIGQIGRLEGAFTTRMVKDRLVTQRGHLGSIDRSAERIVSSLRNWAVLTPADRRNTYAPRTQAFSASDVGLELWLLACAVYAHPADGLPFADLLRLPELFPFRFTLGVDRLRTDPRFIVDRNGSGWHMVRRAEQPPASSRSACPA